MFKPLTEYTLTQSGFDYLCDIDPLPGLNLEMGPDSTEEHPSVRFSTVSVDPTWRNMRIRALELIDDVSHGGEPDQDRFFTDGHFTRRPPAYGWRHAVVSLRRDGFLAPFQR